MMTCWLDIVFRPKRSLGLIASKDDVILRIKTRPWHRQALIAGVGSAAGALELASDFDGQLHFYGNMFGSCSGHDEHLAAVVLAFELCFMLDFESLRGGELGFG
jgi:hypothetical protein